MSDLAPAGALDLVGPFRGPCALCGGPDARHRVADAVLEQVRAGDSLTAVAADYGLPAGSAAGIVLAADASLVLDRGPREGAWGESTAMFDAGRRYRYVLTRTWGSAPPLAVVMLNPSTADAFQVDPTVRRCLSRAVHGGYGGLLVLNVFALRSTDPTVLYAAADPAGPLNDAAILHHLAFQQPRHVVCAWGTHGAHRGRGEQVRRMLTAAGHPLLCLGLTKHGHPRHPLYVRGDAPLVPYPNEASRG